MAWVALPQLMFQTLTLVRRQLAHFGKPLIEIRRFPVAVRLTLFAVAVS